MFFFLKGQLKILFLDDPQKEFGMYVHTVHSLLKHVYDVSDKWFNPDIPALDSCICYILSSVTL